MFAASRRLFSMSTPATRSSPFTQAVLSAIQQIYPDSLADKSFDNTGLLLEAPFNSAKAKPQRNSVLLTIDLTTAVADEAIERRDSVIISYHPIIFKALKSFTLANSQQRSLLQLAAEGISVYSPHTAVDAAQGGNADWLADIITTSFPTDVAEQSERFEGNAYDLHYFPPAGLNPPVNSTIAHERRPIKPDHSDKDAGIGRVVKFEESQPLSMILDRLTRGLGKPKAFQLAIPQWSKIEDLKVNTVAICAGSGGSVVSGQNADLVLTGEMSHHEALTFIEQGQTVICLNHSNSERGYLEAAMKPKLTDALRKEWAKVRADGDEEDINVHVSTRDKDPFGHYITK